MIDKIIKLIESSNDEPINFDVRYSTDINKKINQRKDFYKNSDFVSSWIKENKKVMDVLRDKKDRAKKMDYFYDLFTTDSSVKRLLSEKKKGVKIIGFFCNQIPEELIYASGAIPIRLCSGCNDSIKPAEEAYPKDACPLIKSSVGFAVVNQFFFNLCDVIVIPATCDGKKKLAEFLNDYKPVWVLDLPQSKDKTLAKKYWLSEIRIFKNRIEELTGNAIKKENLKQAINLLEKRNKLIRRLMDLKKEDFSVISGCDSLVLTQSAFFDNINIWIKETEELLKELEQKFTKLKKKDNSGKIRILFTGSPAIVPNLKIPMMIEEFGAVIVIDDTCGGLQSYYDPVVVEEWNMKDMINAISERYLMPSVCPCFIKSEDRIDKLLDLSKEYEVNGIVYNILRLCLLYDIESFKVKAVFEDKKIPLICLNTDYGKEDEGQLKTRIEAFLEIIRENED